MNHVTTPVSHRAVIVALNMRAWKGRATDREVAEKTERENNAEYGTMTVIKQLTPKYLLQPIVDIQRLGRAEHYKMTVPGLFKGQALLATAMFEEYMLTQSEIRDQFFTAVNNLLPVYPSVREKAKLKLGAAYKDKDFPTVETIKSFFDYRVQTGPVPETKDWRLNGLNPDDVENLRSEVEDSVKQMYAEANRTMYDRAKVVLESLIKQATNYTLKAPGAMLRDPTIENLKEVSSLIGAMNITGDPMLDKIGNEMMKHFSDVQGAELRRSPEMRKDVAEKAKAILSKMHTIKRVAA